MTDIEMQISEQQPTEQEQMDVAAQPPEKRMEVATVADGPEKEAENGVEKAENHENGNATKPEQKEQTAEEQQPTEEASELAEEGETSKPRRSTRKRKVSEQPAIPEDKEVTATPSRRKKQKTAAASEPETEPESPRPRGRTRRTSEASTPSRQSDVSRRSSGRVGVGSRHKHKLELEDYIPKAAGERILSCGEGEQLGHPGRTTTRKPRAIDTLPVGIEIIQVAAGGVHSVILTSDGKVYSCGMNEHGTVPVKGLEKEDSTDEFLEIEFAKELKKHGKIVQITAGASFSAALTERGSVIAWGNLRDSQGEIEIHSLLKQMQDHPVVIVRHDPKAASTKRIVKVVAGENHLVMLTDEGEVLTFGDGSMGQLGRSKRLSSIRSSRMVDDSGRSLVISILERGKLLKFVDVFAGGFWSMARADDGRIFACGLNNFGQLGLPLPNIGDSADGAKSEAEYRVPIFTHVKSFPSDKKWTHFKGVKHVIARAADGSIYGIGNNTDNALGIGTYEGQNDKDHWRYLELQEIKLPEGEKAAGIAATLGASIAWTYNGLAYAWGYDTTGQLGVGLSDDDDKMVSTPRKILSAHLNGYTILDVSLADNHALFLAKKAIERKEAPKEEKLATETITKEKELETIAEGEEPAGPSDVKLETIAEREEVGTSKPENDEAMEQE